MTNKRAQKAVEMIKKHGLDAMLFTDMHNIRYLTGFTGSDGILIMTESSTCFMTDSRYMLQADSQVDCELFEYEQKISGLSDYLTENFKKSVIGYESHNITVSFFQDLQHKCNDSVIFSPVTDSSKIRAIKDEDELERIEKAISISVQALESVEPIIRPGVKESDVSLALEIEARKLGSEIKAFDFIVASGKRGAMPHGVASEKVIQTGDVVTIDYGSCWQGYYSDETINFALGTVAPEMKLIHDVVLEAHDRAISEIKSGVALMEIDKIARDFIARKGYGDFFSHGLGHGVGLEVHEWPRVAPRSDVVAEPGMVFTIEPGIYVPGVGGVRIEDMVVVTESGCRCLTSLPKNLRELSN